MRWIPCLPSNTWTHTHTHTLIQVYLINLCLWHWLKKQRALCNHSYIKWSHNQLHIVCKSIKLHPLTFSCMFVMEGGCIYLKKWTLNRLCLWEALDYLLPAVFILSFVPLKTYLEVFKFSHRGSCQLHIKGTSDASHAFLCPAEIPGRRRRKWRQLCIPLHTETQQPWLIDLL